MRQKGRGRSLAPQWSWSDYDKALRIIDPGEALGGCPLGPRDFPRACETLAAGAQHSELGRRGALRDVRAGPALPATIAHHGGAGSRPRRLCWQVPRAHRSRWVGAVAWQ